jgi:PAS domain S-box-containing protein
MIPAAQKTLVLNVDDSDQGRHSKSRILREAGFEVVEAGTGEEALRQAHERAPDLVLLDLQLPDINGLEVCRRLRLADDTMATAVVHISSTFTAQDMGKDSIESGADIFLAEPVEALELVTVVRTLARLRRTETGLAQSEARMRLAIEGTGIGTWEIDLDSLQSSWNKRMFELLGLPEIDAPNWALWDARIDPADAPKMREAMQSARLDGELLDQAIRITRADGGEQRWLSVYGRIHSDEHGRMNRLLGIALDITEQKRLELSRAQLLQYETAAREKAETAAKLQDEFLAMLSHELRTPMSAVLGWLQLLRRGTLESDKQGEALDIIERNAKLQAELITDLLDVSGILAGKLKINPERVDLVELVRASVESAGVAAQKKGVALKFEPTGMPPINADGARLQQVFGNLLANAIKFTPAGGTVQAHIERRGGFVSVIISDNGEGIKPELLPHLFERFLQGDRSRTRAHGGLGLGLAIVKHLVEAHGGRVFANSKGPGQGSTFTVMLQVRLALDEEQGPQAVNRLLTGLKEPPSLAGVKVLVTDDEQASRHLLQHALTAQGAEVRLAESAAQALELFGRWQPDVVLLDIGMPSEDGYTLLRKMHQQGGYRARVPAIALTGYAREEDREEAIAAGFVAHVVKPYNIDDLMRMIGVLARPPQN